MSQSKVYLSRRNLLSLLSKLDRQAEGEATLCTIIKCDNKHPKYAQTMKEISVIAVEDDEYYAHRAPGMIHYKDEPKSLNIREEQKRKMFQKYADENLADGAPYIIGEEAFYAGIEAAEEIMRRNK
jgi:hypothetical protein